jgi:hypothetical protein
MKLAKRVGIKKAKVAIVRQCIGARFNIAAASALFHQIDSFASREGAPVHETIAVARLEANVAISYISKSAWSAQAEPGVPITVKRFLLYFSLLCRHLVAQLPCETRTKPIVQRPYMGATTESSFIAIILRLRP